MKRSTKKIVINCLIIALIACGALWIGSMFIHLGSVEYTNNAQVRQDLVPVNCRVQGYVQRIYVDEFQPVKRGDTLMVIDNAEHLLQLRQAEAALARARAGHGVQERTVQTAGNAEHITRAGIEEVRVLMENARTELTRYQNLYAKESVTKQQLDQKQTDFEALQARYESMLRQQTGSALQTRTQQERLTQAEAEIAAAEAAVELARLNLGYTVITAPCDGYTARKLIQEGELMQPGKLAFTIVSTEDIWLIANFKESQLRHIEVGSKASIKVDAIPDVTFRGEVIAISDATGAQYSPTPTDNSAGNFVKVEGRIPVKLSITEASRPEALKKLRAGLNAEIEIE